MTKLLTLIVACLALGLVVAGCGGDDNGDGDTGSGAAADTAGSDTGGGGGAAAPTGGKAVVMKDIQFKPATIAVAKGDTVTWTNDDTVNHDVTADDKSFSSGDAGDIAPGDTYKHAFDKAGTFKYVCTVHPGMEGEVVVK